MGVVCSCLVMSLRWGKKRRSNSFGKLYGIVQNKLWPKSADIAIIKAKYVSNSGLFEVLVMAEPG